MAGCALTWRDGEVGRAVHRAVLVARGAAEQPSVLGEGLSDHQGADLLCKEALKDERSNSVEENNQD